MTYDEVAAWSGKLNALWAEWSCYAQEDLVELAQAAGVALDAEVIIICGCESGESWLFAGGDGNEVKARFTMEGGVLGLL